MRSTLSQELDVHYLTESSKSHYKKNWDSKEVIIMTKFPFQMVCVEYMSPLEGKFG